MSEAIALGINNRDSLIIVMDIFSSNTSVVELIQLSLAPVFLIVGIGTMLNVVTGRLARIIDRARWYERRNEKNKESFTNNQKDDLLALKKRMKYANYAINFLTGAVVVICIDVILLFVNGLVAIQLDNIIILLFVLALLMITIGLLNFFFEVSVATKTLNISLG